MSDQLIKTSDRVRALQKMFQENQTRIVRAVPRSVASDPQRLLTIAFNTIMYDEKLVVCTQQSLFGGVMEALKLGITIGGPMQEAWLVPFKNRKKNGSEWITVVEATLIIGYQGYRNIIDRGRGVLDMQPRAVHNDDLFDYQFGLHPFINHKPKRPVLTRKDLKAAYCVASLRGGGKQFEVLELEEIELHRKRSRAGETAGSPWMNENDYVAMALKTTIRKLAKYLPKSSELLSKALDLDDRADRGDDQAFEIPTDAVFYEPEGATAPTTPDRMKALNEKLSNELDPLRAAREARERETAPVKGEPSADDMFKE